MTLNNEVFHKTTAEVNTQVASYFTVVDNCLTIGDTNHKYSIESHSCYAPSPPVRAGSSTYFTISPTCDNMADIYNGFIRAQLKVKFTIDTALTCDATHPLAVGDQERYKFNRMWFGFKDAMDAIERYEIMSNGKSIYIQSDAAEESFITGCIVNESVKRSDTFSKTRHKDVWSQKMPACGCYVDWGTRNAEPNVTTCDCPTASAGLYTNEMTIPLKIDLRRFLPLSNIKYLPAFAGKLELKVKFSTQAMVYTPCGPDYRLTKDVRLFNTLTVPNITTEFVPIGEPCTCFVSLDGTELTAGPRTCDVDNKTYYITEAYSVIPNFGIRNEIYRTLVQRYVGKELIFPTQTISVNRMSNILRPGKCSSTFTHTPQYVDSIFFLFPKRAGHHTIFKNPLFNSFQLRCGGYGNIPSVPFDSYSRRDPTFIELIQNAFNLNGNQCGINKEVLISLIDVDDTTMGKFSHDHTNFIIGLPTECDNTFQQGQLSNTPITYQIACDIDEGSEYADEEDPPQAPLMCFLVDAVMAIKVETDGMPPTVELDTFNVTEPHN